VAAAYWRGSKAHPHATAPAHERMRLPHDVCACRPVASPVPSRSQQAGVRARHACDPCAAVHGTHARAPRPQVLTNALDVVSPLPVMCASAGAGAGRRPARASVRGRPLLLPARPCSGRGPGCLARSETCWVLSMCMAVAQRMRQLGSTPPRQAAAGPAAGRPASPSCWTAQVRRPRSTSSPPASTTAAAPTACAPARARPSRLPRCHRTHARLQRER